MSIEIRPATEGEMDQYGLMGSYSYGGSFGDGPDNIPAQSTRPEWTICAFDGPVMATSYAIIPFTFRANGTAMAFGGVTGVGTRPEYRRQGIVRKIVTKSFEVQRDSGQAVAGLWASQAAIYQRYGYAAMGANRTYQVDTVDVNFTDGDNGNCPVRRLTGTEAVAEAKKVYLSYVADRFGYLHRSQYLWGNFFDESGDGPVYAAVAYANDEPQAYVIYTLRSEKVDNVARGQEIKVRDLAWLNMDAYRSLWSYLGQHDLVGRITWENAPVDDPLKEIFMEPRMLHTRDAEGSWLRIVDVEAALRERGYIRPGKVTISIDEDSLAPWNTGTWSLEASPEEAAVTSSANQPDATMSIKSLASLFCGNHSARTLRSWGLLQADDAGIETLDNLFQPHHAPHCPDHY